MLGIAPGLVKLHEVGMGPSLWPVQILLDALTPSL